MRQPAGLCLLFLAGCLTPASLHGAVPHVLAIELLGEGDQIYTCTATVAGSAWTLKAPEATLRDAGGTIVGHHFAGPTWQAADGSKVVGTPLIASAAPGGDSIPWLVLRATGHEGAGLFAEVGYVARTHTVGGTAPASGCDGDHQGADVRIPYKATYTFFTSAAP